MLLVHRALLGEDVAIIRTQIWGWPWTALTSARYAAGRIGMFYDNSQNISLFLVQVRLPVMSAVGWQHASLQALRLQALLMAAYVRCCHRQTGSCTAAPAA